MLNEEQLKVPIEQMDKKTIDDRLNNFNTLIKHWILPGFNTTIYFMMLYCINHFVFWGVEQMHYRWCTGIGLYGFLQSMVTNQSGICSTLRTISGMASSSSTQVLYTVIAMLTTKVYQSRHALHN